MMVGRRAVLKTRGSTATAVVAGILVSLAVAETLHGMLTAGAGRERREVMHALTAQLGLTDLALFTEARYTRHRSVADLHSAFQDAPTAMEHFPAGSLVAPQRAFPRAALRAGTGD
jgi:hypothetical protein